MRRVLLWGSMLALAVTLTACPPPEREPVDVEAGIDEFRESYLDAYNRHDADALAGFYTEDAVFIDADGTHLRGRDELRQRVDQFFVQLRPRLEVTPEETGGEDRLAWQFGSYAIEPQAQMQLDVEPVPGELGVQPTPDPPDAQPQPGQPPVEPELDRPYADPMAMQRQEGRYLIVLERNQDRWLIRAQINNMGMAPGDGMPLGELGISPAPGQPPVAPPPTEPQPGVRPEEPATPPPTEPTPPSPPDEQPDDPPPS